MIPFLSDALGLLVGPEPVSSGRTDETPLHLRVDAEGPRETGACSVVCDCSLARELHVHTLPAEHGAFWKEGKATTRAWRENLRPATPEEIEGWRLWAPREVECA